MTEHLHRDQGVVNSRTSRGIKTGSVEFAIALVEEHQRFENEPATICYCRMQWSETL